MITLQEIESALARGHLWARMDNGNFWELRRNGATQKWKTRPNDFRIPVKAGLKSCGEITHTTDVVTRNVLDAGRLIGSSADFVISETNPTPAKKR